MMTPPIRQFDNVGHSPAWPLIPAAMAELETMGFGFHPSHPPVWHDHCLVLLHDYEVRGFMVYRHEEALASWFILLAWVSPVWRRSGIHTALFSALVERAEARGDILSINSGTHPDNLPAQAAFEAQARNKSAIMYRYPIREHLAGRPYLDLETK